MRAYDLRAGRLLPKPIVDPREPGERMSGLPITRATSPDGRWEYTLYDGPEYPFVHALDTERKQAFCIDLDGLGRPRGSLWGAKLELESGGGATLAVVFGDRALARIDTRMLRVSGSRQPRRAAAAADELASVPWLLVLVPTVLLAAAGSLAARARTRRRRARA